MRAGGEGGGRARSIVLVAVASLAMAATPALAQFVRFTPPGSLGVSAVPIKQALDEEIENARWRLGRFRLDPVVALSNVSYVDNVFASPDGSEAVSDFRATATGGLKAYLGFSPKARLAAFATGRYDWWQERDELSEFGASYGAGFYGFFNRLTVTVEGSRRETEEELSSELEVPFRLESDSARLRASVALGARLSVFTELQANRDRHSGAVEQSVSSIQLEDLDRDRTSANLGLEWKRDELWAVRFGYEHSETEFETSRERDNTAESPFIGIQLTGAKLRADLLAHSRTIEFEPGSPLGEFEETTGTARVSWSAGPRTDVTGYAGQVLSYTVESSDDVFVSRRFGLRIGRELSPRADLAVFIESGDDRYRQVTDAVRRIDDFSAIGIAGTIDVRDNVSVQLSLSEDEYDSNLQGFDRTSRTFGAQLVYRGGFQVF